MWIATVARSASIWLGGVHFCVEFDDATEVFCDNVGQLAQYTRVSDVSARMMARGHISIPARQILRPILRSDALCNDEQPLRIIFVLDALESRIV